MSISLGSTNFGSLYLGSTKIGEAYLGNVKVYPSGPNYNPLNLPPYTIRLKFTDGSTPVARYGTLTQVSSSPNVWDLTYSSSNWSVLCRNQTPASFATLIEVLGANSQGVTNMSDMFYNCQQLTTVALFDTTAVTNMSYMFNGCKALTSAPAFDTSAVTNMSYMFSGCQALVTCPTYNTRLVTRFDQMFFNGYALTAVPLFDVTSATNVSYMFSFCSAVESGSLALYNALSAKTWSSRNDYYDCFRNCGSNTTSGSAELAQIPSRWGGTGPNP